MGTFPVLIINMAKDLERYVLSSNELAKISSNLIRIDAVSGRALAENQILIENPSVVACWLSHQKAYQYIVENNLSGALVVEDDVQLINHSRFSAQLSKIDILSLDILQLGFIAPHPIAKFELFYQNLEHSLIRILIAFEKVFPKKFLNAIVRVDLNRNSGWNLISSELLGGSHCYYISNSGAKKMINLNIPVVVPVDGFLKNAVSTKLLIGARTRRSLASQRASVSTITGRKNNIR